MPVDERRRLQLADAAKRAFGDDEGITLMELLPPVGWADVATRHDVALLGARLDELEAHLDDHFDARFERGFRTVIVTMSSIMIGGFLATVLAVGLAVAIR
jgi:hypothetical protein